MSRERLKPLVGWSTFVDGRRHDRGRPDRLIARESEGGRHLLRFRGSKETRRRLEAIVAAEAAEAVASQLASAF